MEITDGALFEAARNGDAASMALLVDRHKDALVNYLTRLAGCRDRAEDLAQESFLRLIQRSASYRERGHLKAYLYQIATNLARTGERRRRTWRAVAPLWLSTNGHAATRADQQRSAERRELAERLHRALGELPYRYRIPVVLRDVEDWSYRDIAEVVGCKEGTVKSRIHRGRARLRRELAPDWQGGLS